MLIAILLAAIGDANKVFRPGVILRRVGVVDRSSDARQVGRWSDVGWSPSASAVGGAVSFSATYNAYVHFWRAYFFAAACCLRLHDMTAA